MSKDETSSGAIVTISGALLTNKQQLARFQKSTAKQIGLIARDEKMTGVRRLFIGLALHIIKESLDHGEWTPWTEKHVLTVTSQRQMHYMMAAAEVWVEKSGINKPQVAALPSGKFSLKLRDGAQGKLIKAATEFIGDLTWGELLAEHEIREGAPALGGARPHGKGKAKKQSAEQLYLFARDEIGTAIDSLERVIVKENLLQHMVAHPEEVAGVVESLRRVADQVEEAAKPLLKK
jgi:hypothetical protein